MAKQSPLSKLQADIKALSTSAGKQRDKIQKLAVECARYAFGEGVQKNAAPMTQLVYAMAGTGLSVESLIKWAQENTPVLWRHPKDENGQPDESKPKAFGENKAYDKSVFDEAALMATPWWVHVKQPKEVATEYDVAEAVRNLIAKAQREVDNKGKNIKTIKNVEVLADLKALIARLPAAEME